MSDTWAKFVRQEIEIWREFHDYWLLEPLIPTHVIRYEDLVEQPKNVLIDLFKFLLNVNDIEGTTIDFLIEEETSSGKAEYEVQEYPFFSSIHFSEKNLKIMRRKAGMTLVRLGYVKNQYGDIKQISKTDFFDNDDIEESEKFEKDKILRNTTESTVNVRYNFDDLNKTQMDWILSEKYQDLFKKKDFIQFELNMDIENLRTQDGKNLSAVLLVKEAQKKKKKSK